MLNKFRSMPAERFLDGYKRKSAREIVLMELSITLMNEKVINPGMLANCRVALLTDDEVTNMLEKTYDYMWLVDRWVKRPVARPYDVNGMKTG